MRLYALRNTRTCRRSTSPSPCHVRGPLRPSRRCRPSSRRAAGLHRALRVVRDGLAVVPRVLRDCLPCRLRGVRRSHGGVLDGRAALLRRVAGIVAAVLRLVLYLVSAVVAGIVRGACSSARRLPSETRRRRVAARSEGTAAEGPARLQPRFRRGRPLLDDPAAREESAVVAEAL